MCLLMLPAVFPYCCMWHKDCLNPFPLRFFRPFSHCHYPVLFFLRKIRQILVAFLSFLWYNLLVEFCFFLQLHYTTKPRYLHGFSVLLSRLFLLFSGLTFATAPSLNLYHNLTSMSYTFSSFQARLFQVLRPAPEKFRGTRLSRFACGF